jgi:hypothetical protein
MLILSQNKNKKYTFKLSGPMNPYTLVMVSISSRVSLFPKNLSFKKTRSLVSLRISFLSKSN